MPHALLWIGGGVAAMAAVIGVIVWFLSGLKPGDVP